MGGPQPQTFEWPDLDYPAPSADVCRVGRATVASPTMGIARPTMGNATIGGNPRVDPAVQSALPPPLRPPYRHPPSDLIERMEPMANYGVVSAGAATATALAHWPATTTRPPSHLEVAGLASPSEPQSAVLAALDEFDPDRREQLLRQLDMQLGRPYDSNGIDP